MAEKGTKKQAAVKRAAKTKRSSKSTTGKSLKNQKKREGVAVGDDLLLETVSEADLDLATSDNDGPSACPPLEEKYFSAHDSEHEEDSMAAKELVSPKAVDESLLQVKLSLSLRKKLKQQAADEGLSLEDFISELLAESVVLRAWEIVERKNQMRGPSNSHNAAGSGHRSGNNQQNRGNRKGHRGMSHGRYQSIMDDKATFLEYVRNQERSRR